MRRTLPTAEEAVAILRSRKTRPPHRTPPPAGRALNGLVKALDDKYGAGPAALQGRWKEIVGENLARRTEPVKIIKSRTGEGGTLELRVDGPMATLIQHQAAEIMARLDLILGKGAVTKLRIVQGPVKAPTAAAKPGRRRKPPLDAATEASLETSLKDQPDGPLKAALLKLGREVLRGAR